MTTQLQIKISPMSDLNIVPEPPNPAPDQPIHAISCDYGFDCDEEELGRELIAPLRVFIENLPNKLIGVEEFDLIYRWFVS